jgi:Acyl-CoA dehydrogenase, N-terminal domain
MGFGFVELGIVLEEMGRALVCAPYFSSAVLATTAILNGADETQKQALLPGLALGDTVATSTTLACRVQFRLQPISCQSNGSQLNGRTSTRPRIVLGFWSTRQPSIKLLSKCIAVCKRKRRRTAPDIAAGSHCVHKISHAEYSANRIG